MPSRLKFPLLADSYDKCNYCPAIRNVYFFNLHNNVTAWPVHIGSPTLRETERAQGSRPLRRSLERLLTTAALHGYDLQLSHSCKYVHQIKGFY